MENNWTVQDFRNYREEKAKQESSKNRFLSKKVIVDGLKFDSKKEASYYGQLKVKKACGRIKDFQRQVRFNFVLNDVKIGYYKADFVEEMPDGSKQIIDVKSEFTRKLPRYRKQKKLMLAFHGINIIEK